MEKTQWRKNMETVNQETGKNETPKTFSQEEVNAIVGERLSREREKYSDYEDLKAKADKLAELENASKSELEKAVEKATALENELNSLKNANEIRCIRDKVAEEKGIPSDLLNGNTLEECQAQADKLLSFKNSHSGYPSVKDGGENNNVNKGTAQEQFTDWFNEHF